MPTAPEDPWASVRDLRGVAHYEILQIKTDATPAQIRGAYRAAARAHHPDKGGDASAFAKVQLAFETLSDPKRRETYDLLAREHEFRYIPGVTPRARGGEDVLLDDLERLGLRVDGGTQLVALCEVCGRPSNKVCYACTCLFCDFCSRKPHWKGAVGLHYPVTNAPGSMAKKLAEKELEQKRIEDAEKRQLADPNYRTDRELQEARAFKEAAAEVYGIAGTRAASAPALPPGGSRAGDGDGDGVESIETPGYASSLTARSTHHTRTYDLRLAKYYKWEQTEQFVYVSVHVPTSYEDKELVVDVADGASGVLKIQAEDSAPVIERRLAYRMDVNAPVDSVVSKDKRRMTITLTKAEPGKHWRRLFEGDPDGARCLKAPYSLHESDEDVVMEFELPFWIYAEDIDVKVTDADVSVKVRGEIGNLRRTFWKCEDKHGCKKPLIVASETAWSLDKETKPGTNEPVQMLTVCMMKREPDQTEIGFKKGKVQDNRYAGGHSTPADKKGVRLFVDDRDDYFLEDDLMALCFLETGTTWRPAKPWNKYWGGPAASGPGFKAGDDAPVDAEVRDVDALPANARNALEQLLEIEERNAAPDAARGEKQKPAATWDDDDDDDDDVAY